MTPRLRGAAALRSRRLHVWSRRVKKDRTHGAQSLEPGGQ